MPTRGTISTETFTALQAHHDGLRIATVTSARLPVVDARNLIAAQMLAAAKTNPSVEFLCLWVDSDAWWGPKTIAQAVAILTARPDIDLLAASFSTRLPYAPRTALRKADDLESFPKPGIDCEMRDLVEVEVCGAHFMIHRAELLERIGPSPFQVYDFPHNSEDFGFCKRVKKNGGHIFCAPGLIVGHVDPNDGSVYIPGEAALRIENNRLVRTGLAHLVPKSPEFRKYGIPAMDALTDKE